MSLRQEVMACLRERLSNRGKNGPVFSTNGRLREWFFGVPNSGEGFLENPKAALEMAISAGSASQMTHAGVSLTLEEESALKKVIQAMKDRRSLALAGVPAADGAGVALCNPFLDPECFY